MRPEAKPQKMEMTATVGEVFLQYMPAMRELVGAAKRMPLKMSIISRDLPLSRMATTITSALTAKTILRPKFICCSSVAVLLTYFL